MKVQFGLPLTTPINQTLLPVVVMRNSTAEVMGYVPIAETEFNDGAITQMTINQVVYNIGSVTIPPQGNHDQTNYPVPTQYVAILFTDGEAAYRPWIGIANFRSNDHAGFASHWTAAQNAKLYWTFGPLVGSLVRGMDRYPTVIDDPETPEPGTIDTATLSWTASLDAAENSVCSHFDFNWFEVFQAEVTAGRLPLDAIPLSISILSQPPANTMVAEIVPIPTLLPEFGKVYNTIRIRRLSDSLPTGDYAFTFQVRHIVNGVEASKDVEFTLTIR